MKSCVQVLLILLTMSAVGCVPAKAPVLPEQTASAPLNTSYTQALADLNLVLETYLPPSYSAQFYYVKPIGDATGISATTEIPYDITTLVRDAVSQVYHKVRYVEQYDSSDLTHQQVLNIMQQTNKLEDKTRALRPAADFTISGAISQFDRNLESTSEETKAKISFGGGAGQTDIDGSAKDSSRLSRLGISLNVTNFSGVSVPGKYGATTELAYAKNGVDIGFAIYGNGLGYASEATAMHGRHFAIQMLCELSIVQVIGRTQNVPYWRVGSVQGIFQEDPLVINAWREEFSGLVSEGGIIPSTQAALIANGYDIAVTGVLDGPTQSAIQEFCEEYGLRPEFPSFALHKTLELNRILDSATAARAWGAYEAFKERRKQATQSAPAPQPAPAPQQAPVQQQKAAPAPKPVQSTVPSAAEESQVDDTLDNLF